MSKSNTQTNPQDEVEKFTDFLERYYKEELSTLAQNYPREKRSIHIDYDDLYRFDDQLAYNYVDNPSRYREQAEDALTQTAAATTTDDGFDSANIRLYNGPEIDIREIRSDDISDLLTVSGVIAECSDTNPEIAEAAFRCVRCETVVTTDQNLQSLTEPHRCPGCEENGPFNFRNDYSTYNNVQKVMVQEDPEEMQGGEEPSSRLIRLKDDVAGTVVPGQKVTVTGELCLFDPTVQKDIRPDQYIDGHDIIIDDETFGEMEISKEDEQAIKEKSNDPDIYEQMVGSVAPNIYGHEDLKESIVLQMFSGVEKHQKDGSRIRGDIHVLAIGDPGTGKSQILQYIRKIAPRAVYSQGKGSSAAGLTASAVKGGIGDEDKWTVKAGTLVMADRGIAAVDELDKMSEEDRSALHQGLEQGEVTTSKAGMNVTLKSRCAMVAAANPKYGRFDQYESLAEQIDLEPALISRFDLIFTVTDDPNPEEDERLAEHILQSNYAGELNTRTTNKGHSKQIEDPHEVDIESESEDVMPDIDPDMLRKYIAYSKQNCSPTLTDDSKKLLKDFYVDLREEGEDDDAPVPVTARKLEAMIRLGEASARVRLSEKVTKEDANRAIAVVKKTLQDVGLDPETGELDVDTIETGTTKSQRDRIKDMKALVGELEDDYDEGAPMEVVLDEAEEIGISRSKAEHEIEKLSRQGELYEPRTDHLRPT